MSTVINFNATAISNVKLIRNELNLTQEEFGKLIGATKAQIYNYEKGKTTPIPSKYITRIAKLGGVTAEVFKSKKLTAKDLSISPDLIKGDNQLIPLIAKVIAQQQYIIKQISAQQSGKSKQKFLVIEKQSENEIEENFQAILSELKSH